MNINADQPRSSRDSSGGIRALELLVLGACTFVVVGGFIAVCVVIWPGLNVWTWPLFNPSKWKPEWFAGVGAWVGGMSTATAIWFSVKIARDAQATSIEALRVQISEDSRREQRQSVRDVWMRIRAQREAIDRFIDLWHEFAYSRKGLEGAVDPDQGGLDSPQNRANRTLRALHDFQEEALALGASAKDAFLEPMWTVSDEEVRPELEKLHKDFVQLNAFIEHCYMNLPHIRPLFDSSVGEELILVQIRESIVTHSDQLIRSVQRRLGQPNLPMFG